MSARQQDDSARWRYECGAGIRGEKIIGQAFKVEDKGVVPGSSRHRRQLYFLRDAKCVIDKAFEVIPEE